MTKTNKFFFLLLLILTLSAPAFSAMGSFAADGEWGSMDNADAFMYRPSTNKTANFTGPVPSNEWWSGVLVRDDSSGQPVTLTPYPLYFFVCNAKAPAEETAFGIAMSFSGRGALAGNKVNSYRSSDVIVRNGSLVQSASKTRVDGYGDYHVRLVTADTSSHQMVSTIVSGSPFSYHTFTNGSPAVYLKTYGSPVFYDKSGTTVSLSSSYTSDHLIVRLISPETMATNYYGLFTATNTVFTLSETTLSLSSPSYLTIGLVSSLSEAQLYYTHAYAMVTNTKATYSYKDSSAEIVTTYEASTTLLRTGSAFSNSILTTLFPHQYKALSNTYSVLSPYFYTQRGKMKLFEGNTFITVLTNYGVMPFWNEPTDSPSYNRNLAVEYLVKNQNYSYNVDTYDTGKCMLRVSESIQIADQLGQTTIRDQYIESLYSELTNWFTWSGSANEPHFIWAGDTGPHHYIMYNSWTNNNGWGGLIPFRSGFGVQGMNDKHFHFGYFIHAASVLAKYHPTFKQDYGWAVEEVIRDIASPNRDDAKYPYLRYFSPYSGHSFACGWYMSDNYQGNDQESSSEALHAWSSIYQWGLITGDKTYRDLGLYLYWTEKSAVDQYWFDVDDDVFIPDYNHILTVILRETAYEYTTYFGSHPEYFYGIQTMPITPSTLYFGVNQTYAKKYWSNLTNDNLSTDGVLPFDHWDGRMLRLWALTDPDSALANFVYGKANVNASTDVLGTHESWVSLYHYLNNLVLLGTPCANYTADYPAYGVFQRDGHPNFIAYNPYSTNITVTFKDSNNTVVETMTVSPGETKYQLYTADLPPTSPNLTNLVCSGRTAKLYWTESSRATGYRILYGSDSNYINIPADTGNVQSYTLSNLTQGLVYYFKVVALNSYGQSGPSKVLSSGVDPEIQAVPGKIEAENYSIPFCVSTETCGEGGIDVSYIDTGDYIDYVINVADTGYYTVDFRIASESVGGTVTMLTGSDTPISEIGAVSFSATGAWQSWTTFTSTNVYLEAGKQNLRLYVTTGGFNLNWFQFKWAGGSVKPKQPVITAVSPKDAMLSVTWSVANDAESYWVKYGTTSGVYTSATNVGSALTADLTNMVNGTTYYISVCGSNSVGEGPASVEWEMEPRDTSHEPAQPTTLKVTSLLSNSISLSWTDNATNESAYLVYCNLYNQIPASPSAILSANITSFSTNGLTPSTNYFFWVKASNEYATSEAASVFTNTPSVIPPVDPYSLIIQNTGNNNVKFSIRFTTKKSTVLLFAKRNGVQDYANDIASTEVNNGDGTYSYSVTRSSVYTNGDIIVGRIYAVTSDNTVSYFPGPSDSQWYSPYTNQNIVLTDEPPYDPTGFTATAKSSNIIVLSWTDNALNESAYHLFQSTENVKPASFTTLAADKSGYSVSNLLPSTTYYFWLEATNEWGSSATVSASATTTAVGEASSNTTTPGVLKVENVGGLTVRFSITLDAIQIASQLFVQRNGNAYISSLELPYTANGDGTYTYSTNLSGFTAGDLVRAYVYTYKTAQVWYPGPNGSTWTTAITVSDAVKPDCPQVLSVVPGNKTLTLNWSAAANAQGYKVKFGRSSGSYTALRVAGNVTSYTITNLLNERQYYISVSATNDWQESTNSSEVSGIPVSETYNRPVLGTPVAGNASATLAWSKVNVPASVASPVITYTVKVGTASQRYFMSTSTTDTNCILSGLTNGVTYYVSVGTLVSNSSGFRRQVMTSAEKVFTPTASAGSIMRLSSSLQATESASISAPVLSDAIAGDASILLSWKNGSATEGTMVLYGTEEGVYSSTNYIASVNTFALNGLKNGTNYFLALVAYNSAAESPVAVLSAIRPEAGKLKRPEWISAKGENRSASLSWTEVVLPSGSDAAISYQIILKSASGTEKILNSRTPSCQITGLKNGTLYSVKIRAIVTTKNGSRFTLPVSTERLVKPTAK